jgi:hypothetical protein
MAGKGKLAVDEPIRELRRRKWRLERGCPADQDDFVEEVTQFLCVGGYSSSNMHVFGNLILECKRSGGLWRVQAARSPLKFQAASEILN